MSNSNEMNRPSIEVKPVVWTGDIILKFQAFATVFRSNGEKKVMTGVPCDTEGAALEALKIELRERLSDVRQSLIELDDPLRVVCSGKEDVG